MWIVHPTDDDVSIDGVHVRRKHASTQARKHRSTQAHKQGHNAGSERTHPPVAPGGMPSLAMCWRFRSSWSGPLKAARSPSMTLKVLVLW